MEALGLGSLASGYRSRQEFDEETERGHTQQTLNSSGTLEHSKHLPFCNTCLTKTIVLNSGQVRSEIDAILVD